MNNTWSKWTTLFFFIALGAVTWALICNQVREEAVEEVNKHREYVRYIKEEVDSGYIYVDLNGVYHYANDCYILRDDDNSAYSYKHFKKSSVTDWELFFETEQVCVECFETPYINQLKKTSNTLDYMMKNQHNEQYRDADEEYYNQYDD